MWVGPGVGGTRGGALTIKKAQLVVIVLPISMMSLLSWVRALTEAKEKGKGLAITILVSGDHKWVGPGVGLSQ